MSDLSEWIKERRRIHDAAAEGPWKQDEEDGVRGVALYTNAEDEEFEDRWERQDADIRTWDADDAAAIVDAHNVAVPVLLTAVENVLKRHKPVHQVFSWQAGGTTAYDPCETCHGKAGVHECGCWADKDLVYTCAECRDDKGRDIDYPCQTVRSIEGAINE